MAALGPACSGVGGSGAGGSGAGGSVTARSPESASGAGGGRTGPLGLAASSSSGSGGGRTGPLGLAASSSSGSGGGRTGPLGVVASSSSGSGGGGASTIAEAGGGGAGLCSALTVTTGEMMADSGTIAAVGGKLGGVLGEGAAVGGTTMGSRISVLSSGPGTSGFWAGVVVVPAPLIMPIRSSTPSEDGSSAEEGTNRMFVSTTGGLSCDSLRFLIVTILYSRSTKVGLGGHIPGRKGPYRDLVYTRGSIGSVDA